MHPMTIGLPRQHKEPGEKRDFLPPFVGWLHRLGFSVFLEEGYGAGMGFSRQDYLELAPGATFTSMEETCRQDYVLILRYPNPDMLEQMHPGSCLISMCHFPTRPHRVEGLRAAGLEAISLDSLKDDSGRRLVENLRAVAWNGAEAAFQALATTYPAPGLESPNRPAIRVTLMGAGAVGSFAVRAAVHYGREEVRARMLRAGAPGVLVQVVDFDLTQQAELMRELLSCTDILIDATQRPDPSQPVIPNEWVAFLPAHAVLLDLSVDPYDCSESPAFVKGIEGIPQGNLDQYLFLPDDPVYSTLPECVRAGHRRTTVSCYSWPGVHPKACMQVYGGQLQPILRTLAEKGGLAGINPHGKFFERAIGRAQLSRWETDS